MIASVTAIGGGRLRDLLLNRHPMMGTMMGVAGGVLRDILTAQVPLILRGEIYATAAIAGVTIYLLLQAIRIPRSWAVGVGLATVVMLRLLSIVWAYTCPCSMCHARGTAEAVPSSF